MLKMQTAKIATCEFLSAESIYDLKYSYEIKMFPLSKVPVT